MNVQPDEQYHALGIIEKHYIARQDDNSDKIGLRNSVISENVSAETRYFYRSTRLTTYWRWRYTPNEIVDHASIHWRDRFGAIYIGVVRWCGDVVA